MNQPSAPSQIGFRYERWRWQIFGITWLAYVGFYLTRKSFSIAKIQMEKPEVLGLSKASMGYIDGASLICYACGQFLWGMCGDRFGTRVIVLTGMAVSIAAAFAMGASSTVTALITLSAVQGLAQSTGWAPLNKNMSCFFSQRERGTVLGLWSTNYAVGGFIAALIAGAAISHFGYYKAGFYIPATMLGVIFVLFFFLQRDKPEDLGLPPIEEYHGEPVALIEEGDRPEDEPARSWSTIFEVITNPMVVLLAGVYFLLKPARYAILLWGPLYVKERLGTDVLNSSFLSSLFELAGPLSVFAGGWISDRFLNSRRMPVIVVCLLITSSLLFVIDKLPVSSVVLGLCFFLTGLVLYAPDSLISGTAAVDFGTKKGASTATGIVNGCGSVGAIVGGTVPGLFFERLGWSGVFNFLAGATLLATLLLLPFWNSVPPQANGETAEKPA